MGAPLAILRGHQKKVTGRNPFGDFLGNVESEVPLQVVNRLLAQRLKSGHVWPAFRVELMNTQEAINLVAVGKVQTVPVDH